MKTAEALHAPINQAEQNAGDQLVQLARDTLHAHLNVIATLADLFVPRSLGGLLYHQRRFSYRPGGFAPVRALQRAVARALKVVAEGTDVASEETNDLYRVHFNVPGIDRAALNVEVGSSGITVRQSGEFSEAKAELPGGALHELRWVAPVPLDSVVSDAKASLHLGVLTVVIPKPAQARSARIEIA